MSDHDDDDKVGDEHQHRDDHPNNSTQIYPPSIVFVRIVFVKSLFRFLIKLMKEIILLYYYHTSNLFWPILSLKSSEKRTDPPHYGLTGHAIKNLKMPKKVRQDNKQAGTENVFCQKWKIIFSK